MLYTPIKEHLKRISCRNCKERKVKCSGERPKCRTCAISNRQCRGYASSSPPNVQDIPVTSSSRDRIVSSVSPRHVFRQQFINAYLDDSMPNEFSIPENRDRFWVVQIADMPTLSPGLEAVILALCTARMGFRDDNDDLTHRSLLMYNKGIRDLQKAINHPTLRDQDQTLATCVAFTMFQFASGVAPKPHEFMSHYYGTMEVLRLRGPLRSGSGLGYSIFRTLRVQSVYMGITLRKPTFLAEKQWLELPWLSRPPKDSFDTLIDTMLKLPNIYNYDSEAFNEHTPTPARLAACIRCVEECWRIDSELTGWLGHIKSEIDGPLYWPELSPSSTPSSSEDSDDCRQTTTTHTTLFPVQYKFTKLSSATSMTQYWAARMLVAHHLGLVYQALEGLIKTRTTAGLDDDMECTCSQDPEAVIKCCIHHFNVSQLPPLGYRKDWSKNAACHICQSVQFFLQPNSKSSGPMTIQPLLLLVKSLWIMNKETHRSDEIAWIDEKLRKIESMKKLPPRQN